MVQQQLVESVQAVNILPIWSIHRMNVMNDIFRNYLAALKAIRSQYFNEKSTAEKSGDWVAYYVYRPVSFVITPIFIAAGTGATAVTAFSLLAALTMPIILLFNPSAIDQIMYIALIVMTLDCVDGNLARYHKKASNFGFYIDFFTDIVFRISLYFCIGLYLLYQPQQTSVLLNPVSLVFFAVLLSVVARLCRLTTDGMVNDDKSSDVAKVETLTSNRIYSFLSGLDLPFLPILLLVCSHFEVIYLLPYWLIFYGLLDMFSTQFSILAKLK